MNAPRHLRRHAVLGLVAASMLLCPVALASAQPSAAYLASPNGIAGLAQPIVLSIPEAHGSTVTLTATTQGASISIPASLDGQGAATVQWTPSASGVWTLTASNSAVRSQLAVAPIPTTISVSAPGQLQLGVAAATTIAYVRALSGDVAPQGSVTLRNRQGVVLGTGLLQASTEPALSTAAISWTPDQAGVYLLSASYTPATTITSASVSSVVQPEIVGPAPMVSYRFAPALRLGVTSNVSAVLAAGMTPGSVGFIFDGVAPRGSVPTVAGVATTPWAPPTEGLHQLRAEFTGNNPGYSGVALQQIKVLPAAVPDSIDATLGARRLLAQGPNALAVGTSQELSAVSASGSPVVFSASGSCVIAGSRLTALRSGSCLVSAKSFGGEGFTAGKANYAVTTAAVTVQR